MSETTIKQESTERAYNGHVRIRTRPWSRSVKSHFLLPHVDGRVHVHDLPGEEMVPGFSVVGRQASRGGVMLQSHVLLENPGWY